MGSGMRITSTANEKIAASIALPHILDTQMVSYWWKGSFLGSEGVSCISSATAIEFLLMRRPGDRRPNYFVPLFRNRFPQLLHYDMSGPHGTKLPASTWMRIVSERLLIRGSSYTDESVFDMGVDYGFVSEYGNRAITDLINYEAIRLLDFSIDHLPKSEKKAILQRFSFLIKMKVKCIPWHSSTEKAVSSLFAEFQKSYQPKGNIRNTLNDLIILSTALENEMKLISYDSLLNTFSAQCMNAPIRKVGEFVVIDFSKETETSRERGNESKGYVNRSWQHLERNDKT